MNKDNEGFNPIKIKELKDRMYKEGKSYIINDTEDNTDEYVNFFFVGMLESKEVIYDAVIYTLRLHHNSEVYEIAEHKAAQRFPEYKNFNFENGDNKEGPISDMEDEIGLFMAEIIMELEEEETVKVQEHVEIDPIVDYGVGLDAGLNVDTVTEHVIEKFIEDYNKGILKLDKTLYSFQTQENEDDID